MAWTTRWATTRATCRRTLVGEDHTGEMTFKVDYLTLAPGAANSVLGHSIMVHEKADDMKTDPTGNAGNRIACGVIPAPSIYFITK
jgi:Cu-Zn family superoxide dismutase